MYYILMVSVNKLYFKLIKANVYFGKYINTIIHKLSTDNDIINIIFIILIIFILFICYCFSAYYWYIFINNFDILAI